MKLGRQDGLCAVRGRRVVERFDAVLSPYLFRMTYSKLLLSLNIAAHIVAGCQWGVYH